MLGKSGAMSGPGVFCAAENPQPTQCFSLQYELILPQNTGRRVPWARPYRTCTFPCKPVGPRGVPLPVTGHPLTRLPIFKYLPEKEGARWEFGLF